MVLEEHRLSRPPGKASGQWCACAASQQGGQCFLDEGDRELMTFGCGQVDRGGRSKLPSSGTSRRQGDGIQDSGTWRRPGALSSPRYIVIWQVAWLHPEGFEPGVMRLFLEGGGLGMPLDWFIQSFDGSVEVQVFRSCVCAGEQQEGKDQVLAALGSVEHRERAPFGFSGWPKVFLHRRASLPVGSIPVPIAHYSTCICSFIECSLHARPDTHRLSQKQNTFPWGLSR